MRRESANRRLSRFALEGEETMERKRVAGRFAAEDKGGVVKKQAVAPRARKGSKPHEAVLTKPDGSDHKDSSQKPDRRAKGLLDRLLHNWRRNPAAPIPTDDADSTALDGGGC